MAELNWFYKPTQNTENLSKRHGSFVLHCQLGKKLASHRISDDEKSRPLAPTMEKQSQQRPLGHLYRLICVVTFHWLRLKAATKNFKVTFIIGVGGFGNVYKGYIDGGANHVAIKRLRPESSQGAGSSRQKLSYSPNSTTAIWFHSLVTAPIMAR
ncbi:hypothetical protein ACFX14_006110 [Malus domestica]